MEEKQTNTEINQTPVSNQEEKPKKKSNVGKTILIVFLVILGLVLLCGVGSFIFARNWVTEKMDEVTGVQEEMEEIEWPDEWEEPDPYTYTEPEVEEELESVHPGVEDALEETSLITSEFPDEMLLPGGTVERSSYTEEYRVNVTINTSSSVEETFLWYEEALEDMGWELTSKNRTQDRASMNFDNTLEDDDGLNGRISISTNEYLDYTTVTVEIYL